MITKDRITPPRNKIEIIQAINAMYAWHGGAGSAFYSFASTRRLWSEEHRNKCLVELRTSRFHAEGLDDLVNLAAVEALIHHADIGQEVCTDQEWRQYDSIV